jgi:hypothetical protein
MSLKVRHAIQFLQCLLLVWNFKSLNLIISLWSFFKSSAVGSTVEKARIRFLDLRLILKVDGRSLKVVELGAGSSTIFFLSQKQVSSLVTLEENSQYLPELKSKKLQSKILSVIEDSFGGKRGTRYQGSEPFLKTADFIYIDGPVSGSDKNRLAQPNLDLLVSSSLDDKTIAIDCRSNTVLLANEFLSKSHYLVPSKSFLHEIHRIGLGVDLDSSQATIKDFRKISGKLVRTSVFLPKKRFES